MAKKLQRSPREADSDDPGSEANEDALRELLAHEAKTSSAKSGANGHFFATRSSARDEETGNVHTGDEENAHGCGEKDIKRSLVILDRIVEHEAAACE